MQKLKKTVSVLLAIITVLSLFTIVPFAAGAVEYGTYTLDDDGTLTMEAGVFSGKPFDENADIYDTAAQQSVKKIVAENGVKLMGDCSNMFEWFTQCREIDLSAADTSGVTGMSEMFYDCTALTTLDISSFRTPKVTDMSAMFAHCHSLPSLDLSGFDTSKVQSMANMFYNCSALSSVNLGSFQTASVYSMFQMFGKCSVLETLDLSSFDTASVTSFSYMFYQCGSLKTIYVSDSWVVSASAGGDQMFTDCTVLRGGKGTGYDAAATGKSRAHVDGGTANPGYLTLTDKVTVTWKNDDGSVLKTETVSAGTVPAFEGTPEKASTPEYDYTFTGWNPAPAAVTEDTVYTAQYTEAKRSYTITWKNDDGSVIDTTQVPYGELPTHAYPSKPGDSSFTYTFTGWDPALTAVTGEAAYTAVFDATPVAPDDSLDLSTLKAGDIISGSYPRIKPGSQGLGITLMKGRWGNIQDFMNYDLKLTAGLLNQRTCSVTNNNIFVINQIGTDTYVPYDSNEKATDQWIVDRVENGYVYLKGADKKLFAGNNLTLNGDILVNFYIDPTPAGVTLDDIQNGDKTVTVSFSWDTETAVTDLSPYNVTIDKTNFSEYNNGQYLKVSCKTAIAEMSCKIKATAVVNGFTARQTYSVRDYGVSALDPASEFSVGYIKTHGTDQYNRLVDLVTKMLDYGAKAQAVFNINTDDPANTNVPGYQYQMQNVTSAMFEKAVKAANGNTSADKMETAAKAINANYYSTSLVYLSSCTLRHYFTFDDPADYEKVEDDFDGIKDRYYYVEKTNIAAAELDDLQTFMFKGVAYYYSALDFANAMVASPKASDASKDLAKALYWYNQAANVMFE